MEVFLNPKIMSPGSLLIDRGWDCCLDSAVCHWNGPLFGGDIPRSPVLLRVFLRKNTSPFQLGTSHHDSLIAGYCRQYHMIRLEIKLCRWNVVDVNVLFESQRCCFYLRRPMHQLGIGGNGWVFWPQTTNGALCLMIRCDKSSSKLWSHCWWKRSCTTWGVWNLVDNGIYKLPMNWCRISSITSSIFDTLIVIVKLYNYLSKIRFLEQLTWPWFSRLSRPPKWTFQCFFYDQCCGLFATPILVWTIPET